MAITVKQVIYLGTFADADTDETTSTVENTGIYQQTFGSAGSPISNNLEDMTFDDQDNSGSIETDNFVTSDTTNGPGGLSAVDSLAVVSVTVTYADSSTATFSDVVMFQTANGDLYLANSDFAGTDLRDPGGEDLQSITVNSVTSTNYTGLLQNNFQNFTCFAAGTTLATPAGPRAVEALTVGDLVETLDHGAQSIRWIGQSTVLAMGRLAPVCIERGAFGATGPARDLLVSPQHRMMLRSPILARMTGQQDALCAAKALVGVKGVCSASQLRLVTYVHVMFDHHEIVIANGIPAESFWPGVQAMDMLGPVHRAAVRAVLYRGGAPDFGPPARAILSGAKRKRAVARHVKNEKPLLTGWPVAGQYGGCDMAG